jgi:GNAT superfamily N-acetyltransferase
MAGERWSVTDEPDPFVLAELEQHLADAARRATGADVERELAVVVHSAEGELVGGVHGTAWGGLCELHGLWVRPDRRGAGLARELITRVEEAARDRGCTQVLLLAYDVLMAGFFEPLGYQTVGVVPVGPGGRPVRWLGKAL